METRTSFRKAIARFRSKVAAEEDRGDLAQLMTQSQLLKDFESSGKAWFWETDADGTLSYASETLGQGIGLRQDQLIGRKLGDLVLCGEATGGDLAAHRTLLFHLSHGLTFSDLPAKPIGGGDVWWSLSGRPIRSEGGIFLGFRGFGIDLTDQKRAEAEIAKLAHYDVVTRLPNRILMRDSLEKALEMQGSGVTVLLIDLDRFKQVNDTLGHAAGDALLREVGQRLQSCIGEGGQIGRLGGDEFEAVIPNLGTKNEIGALVQKIVDRLSMPYMIQGSKVVVGASVGIATSTVDCTSPDLLVQKADLALYAAKASKVQRFRFYSDDLHERAQERRTLEADLQSAITEHGLSLNYQPIVEVKTGKLVGFEALLRWPHPTRGMIGPSQFVGLAEETGLITRIGEWVIRTACAEAAHWPKDVRVAVNLSPIQFKDPNLASVILNAISSNQLDPDRLELEITESIFLADTEATEATFKRLAGIGVRFALDDFGTGYSSLSYLQNARFSKVKIDQSFVRGASRDGSRNSSIIKAIVALAADLDMATTAEGVESQQELDIVRNLGCTQAQGYLFGRPMSADAAREFIAGASATLAPAAKNSRLPRHSVLKSAILHFGARSVPIRIRNVSAGGALVESPADIPANTNIRMEISTFGLVAGFVCWSRDGKAGIRFDADIDPALLLATRGAAAAA